MAHDIFNNAAFSLREPMWHKLGWVAPEPMTIDQILSATDSDYQYSLAPMTAAAFGTSIPVEGKSAVIRTHPVSGESSYVGVVGDRYTIHTPRALNNFNNTLLDAGVPIETYGLLGGRGERMFLTYRLPQSVQIAGVDQIDSYLFVSTSFDGSRATEFRTTTVRVVCANTFAAAINRTQTLGRIRHSSLLDGQVGAVRAALEIGYTQLQEFEELANQLVSTPMRNVDVDAFLAELFPTPEGQETGRGVTVALNRRAAVKGGLQADTNKQFAGNAWGVFNAYTEWLDHRTHAKTANIRLARQIDGERDDKKARAAQILLAGV